MTGQGPDDERALPDHRITATVGAPVTVEVADLPGAGYRWTARDVPDGVRVVGDESGTVPEPVTERVGGTTRGALRFVAERPGSFVLVLALVRPWEGEDVAPAATRVVALDVHEGSA
jgi:hypothetical protein